MDKGKCQMVTVAVPAELYREHRLRLLAEGITVKDDFRRYLEASVRMAATKEQVDIPPLAASLPK